MIVSSNTSKALLVIIVALFLAMLANGISKKTRAAAAPPIYDPIGYYAKSGLVWRAISEKSFEHAMNWFPYRPPGSSLILYPLGFKHSVKSFLFRSVFAPIFIWSLALTILVLPSIRLRSDALLGGGLIAGLISMPIFYQFQINEYFSGVYRVGNQWGLVDPMQGTVAALGVGLMIVGISRRSLTLCSAAWFAAAYTLFIKPSGILTMGGIFGIAMVELFIRYYSEPNERRSTLKSGALILACGVILYGTALYIAFHTDYMGKDAVAKGLVAQKIDIGLHQGALLPQLYFMIQPVIGWWWFLPLAIILIGCVIEAIRLLRQHRLPSAGLRLAASAAIAAATVWWWVNLAGMEHRFLFPVLLMLMAWLISDIFVRLKQLTPKGKKLAVVYCVIPCILLSVMLHARQIDTRLQRVLGVNLTNDQYGDAVIEGKWLVAQATALKRPARVYCMGDGIQVGVVEMIDWIESIEHHNKPPSLILSRPNNWLAHPGLKMDELVASDFLLMEKLPTAATPGPVTISDWQEEPGQFKEFAYLGRGTEKNGLEVAFDGPVKILKIVDAQKFADTLYAWAQSIEWKNDFPERNKEFLEKHKQTFGKPLKAD